MNSPVILAAVLALPVCIGLSISAAAWAQTVVRYRSFPMGLLLVMLRVTTLSRRWVELLISAAILLYGMLTALLPVLAPLPYWLLVGTGLHLLSALLLAPVILFLGASGPASHGAVTRIARAFWPMRVSHLLAGRWTSLRTRDPVSWRGVVDALAVAVPFIVVDTRTVTEQILDETVLVLRPGFAERTLFLVDRDGTSPVLERVGGDRTLLHLVEWSAFDAALRNLRRYGRPD